jgi:hypothetical protein
LPFHLLLFPGLALGSWVTSDALTTAAWLALDWPVGEAAAGRPFDQVCFNTLWRRQTSVVEPFRFASKTTSAKARVCLGRRGEKGKEKLG